MTTDDGRLGIALVGTGWVAGEYVKAFRDHPRTTVVGAYNRTPGKATRLFDAHHVIAREYGTLDELLADERIDIVVSCTPAHVRRDHVVAAAESGRHVVIEKPVASTMDDVLAIRDAVASANVKSVASFVLRWNPQIRTIKKLVDDGIVGDLVYAEADYWHPITPDIPSYRERITSTLGSALHGGCHAVDAMRHLGGEIVEVSAFAASGKSDPEFGYNPTVVASVRFANGAVGKVSALNEGETPYVFNTRIIGTTGTIQNNRVYSSAHYPGATGYWEFPTVAPDSGDVSHHPFAAEVADLVTSIDDDVESHASIQDTWRTMAVCFAIEESAANGGGPVPVDLTLPQ